MKASGADIPERGTVLLCTGHHARTFPTPAYSTDNPGVNVAANDLLARKGKEHCGREDSRLGTICGGNSHVHKAASTDITHMKACNPRR